MNTAEPKNAAIDLLRELCRLMQSLPDDQLSQVLDGRAKLEVRVVGRKKLRSVKTKAQLTNEELASIAELLKSCQTREEGNAFLDQRVGSKNDATRLARLLDIPVQKIDTSEQIRARIIESTIGFRIRSAAVQGILPSSLDKSHRK